MCPTTLMIGGLAAGGVATLAGAATQASAAQTAATGAQITSQGYQTQAIAAEEAALAQQQQAQYQAAVLQQNEQIANNNATYAMQSGEQEAATASLAGANNVGQIKVAQAANGVDVNTGSAELVREGARAQNQLSVENILNNAALTSYGYRTNASSFAAEAGLESEVAAQAPVAGQLAAQGDILGAQSALVQGQAAETSAEGSALGSFGTFLGNASGISTKWLLPSGSVGNVYGSGSASGSAGVGASASY